CRFYCLLSAPPAASTLTPYTTLFRSLGEGLARTPLAAELGGVDADQPDPAPTREAHGVAIHHPLDPHRLARLRQRAQGLRRAGPQRKNKKGAPPGRLLVQHNRAHRACVSGLTWRRTHRNAA